MKVTECPSCQGSLVITGVEDNPRLVKTIEWRCIRCSKTGGIIMDDMRNHHPKPVFPTTPQNEEERVTRVILAASRGAFLALAEPTLYLGDATRRFNYAARTFEGDAFENAFEWAREEMKGFDSKKMLTPELLSAAGHLCRATTCGLRYPQMWQQAVDDLKKQQGG